MNGKLFYWMVLTALLMIGEGWADRRQVAQDRVERDALLFQQKCTACHDIQISLSGCYYLPSEILSLVERMAGYNEASIDCCARDSIINFLTYYEATQRKGQVNRALYCLDEWGREAQLRSIRSVLDYYRGSSFGSEPSVVEGDKAGELPPAEEAVAWESGPIT